MFISFCKTGEQNAISAIQNPEWVERLYAAIQLIDFMLINV